MMTAREIAQRAAELVSGDREAQHGDKMENFSNIAALWNAWIDVQQDMHGKVFLNVEDVAAMMVLLKLARTVIGKQNLDDYVDACGYAACMGEVAQRLKEPD